MAALDLAVVAFDGTNLDAMEQRLDFLCKQFCTATDNYNMSKEFPISETLPVVTAKAEASAEAQQLYAEQLRLRETAVSLGQTPGETLPEIFMRQKMDVVWSNHALKRQALESAEEVRRLQLETRMLRAECLLYQSSHV